MNLAPIDATWAREQFPHVHYLCGSFIDNQIACFNEVVAAENTSHLEIGFKMHGHGLKNPHLPLLRRLSALHMEDLNYSKMAQIVGPLLLLEQSLSALSGKWTPRLFKSLIRSEPSFINLVAEADWGASLLEIADHLELHNQTDPDSGKDYDLLWTRASRTFHADIKWYEAWFMKTDGEDIVQVLGQLLPDIPDFLHVRTAGRVLSKEGAIEAAVLIEDMYKSAKKERDTSKYNVVPYEDTILVVNHSQAEPFVNSIEIYTDGRPTGVQVTEVVDNESELEKRRIRRNLTVAARQLPDHSEKEDLCVVLLGSSDPHDFSLVREELLAKETGLYGSTALKHIEGTLFFTLSFAASPPSSLMFLRTCQMIASPGLSSAKREALKIMESSYNSACIPLHLPSAGPKTTD